MFFAGHMYVALYVLYIFVQVEGDLVCYLLVICKLDCMFCFLYVQVEGELVCYLLVICKLDCMFCTYLYR